LFHFGRLLTLAALAAFSRAAWRAAHARYSATSCTWSVSSGSSTSLSASLPESEPLLATGPVLEPVCAIPPPAALTGTWISDCCRELDAVNSGPARRSRRPRPLPAAVRAAARDSDSDEDDDELRDRFVTSTRVAAPAGVGVGPAGTPAALAVSVLGDPAPMSGRSSEGGFIARDISGVPRLTFLFSKQKSTVGIGGKNHKGYKRKRQGIEGRRATH
jgi:hypothetical protein